MEIAIPLYDRFTALDCVGPADVLSRIPGARVRFLAHEPGPVANDNGMLSIVAEGRFEDVPQPDVVLVPGGTGTGDVLGDERLLAWIAAAHEQSQWTTSVCTGSLLLAAAGVLGDVEATCHWMFLGTLGELGARPTGRRVVQDGKIVTAAGVSSGIDMALTLTAQIAGEDYAKAVQLAIEYDPQPPFDTGSPEKAGPEIQALVEGVFAAR